MVSAVIVLLHLLFTSGFSLVKRISGVALIVISALLMAAMASSVGIDMKQIINERILEKGEDISTSSAGARITSYNVFIQKFPEHPWFGVGPHTREDVAALLGEGVPLIHVGYLSYLYYYGVVGCFFIFLSLALLLLRAFMVGLRFKFWGSFYGLMAFSLANATFVYFNFNEAGIILAIVYLRYYKLVAQRTKKNSDEYEYIEAEPAI
jgi:O-antigen ligase